MFYYANKQSINHNVLCFNMRSYDTKTPLQNIAYHLKNIRSFFDNQMKYKGVQDICYNILS